MKVIITLFLIIFAYAKLPPYPISLTPTQHATGRYKIYNTGLDIFSQWVQDHAAKKIRLDIGTLEDGPNFHGIFFFREHDATIVGANGSVGYICTVVPITYERQDQAYSGKHLDYIGTDIY